MAPLPRRPLHASALGVLLIATVLVGCEAAQLPSPAPSRTPLKPLRPTPTPWVPSMIPTITPAKTPSIPSPAVSPPTGVEIPSSGRWVDVGPFIDETQEEGIAWPHVTPLLDGRAFSVGSDNRCMPGGVTIGDARSSRVFDEAEGWASGDQLNKDRGGFVLLTLADGRVLDAGGANADEGPSFSSTRIWDPATEAWSDGQLMHQARTYAFGVVLSDDRVLVGGGTFFGNGTTAKALASVESWDPAGGTWAPEPSLPVALGSAMAARLSDGKVLVIGSRDAAAWDPGPKPLAFVFDPVANDWSAVDPPGPAWDAELLGVDRGAVLISDTVRFFDPSSGSWQQVEAPRRFDHAQAVVLPTVGQVMIAGGQARRGPENDVWPALDEVDLWDANSGEWSLAAPLPEGRQDGELVVLADGSALYAGGGWAGDPTSTPSCPAVADASYLYVP